MRRNVASKKRYIASLLLLCALIMTSCGSAVSDENSADDVELIEPVGAQSRSVKASYRRLYAAASYQGVVCPATVEYTYDMDTPLGNFSALPGDEVSEGDQLFYGAYDDIDDEIHDKKESMSRDMVAYNDKTADLTAQIAKAQQSEFAAETAYRECEQEALDESSPDYDDWVSNLTNLESTYKSAMLQRQKLEQTLLETREQYDAASAHDNTLIKRLNEKKSSLTQKSTTDGIVVAKAPVLSGDMVERGSSLVAVGDPAVKEIVCDYVSKAEVNRASEIFALIDGAKYEVTYENMEPEEYRKLKQSDGEVYTTFGLVDPDDAVGLGSYAVIVVVEYDENALCVPRSAVNRDDNGTYVYVGEDEEHSTYTRVSTGRSDSAYFEITSGLKEGDPVIYEPLFDAGSKEVEVKTGNVHVDLSTGGYLLYPNAEWIKNPVKNGDSYLHEVCVEQYQQVKKGDVLVKVEAVADTVEISRIKRKIQRQNERIADLNAERAVTSGEDGIADIDRAIRDRQRTIDDLNRQLSELAAYQGVFEIKAPYDCIIMDVIDREDGEILNYGEGLVRISKEDSYFIQTDGGAGVLSYGDECVITNKEQGGSYEAVGNVVTVDGRALTGSLRAQDTLIRISAEDLEALTGGVSSDYQGYWRLTRFDIKTTVLSMDHVLLIPKKAVTTIDEDLYVAVRGQDGNQEAVRFVPGGSDDDNYWVAYGDIQEGMILCLD